MSKPVKKKPTAKKPAAQATPKAVASAKTAGTSAPKMPKEFTETVQGNRMWARKLLVILLVVFAAVMGVNAVMVWFAVRSNTGVVTSNAYEEGLAYNKTLAEQAREAGLGWSVVRNVADFPVRLVYALSDAKGAPLGSAWVSVKATRPMNDAAPFEMELQEFTDGTYAADMSWPQKGQWDLETTFVFEGKSLTAHERVTVE